eukprot:9381638-Pyramimonas_sp.AAC.1
MSVVMIRSAGNLPRMGDLTSGHWGLHLETLHSTSANYFRSGGKLSILSDIALPAALAGSLEPQLHGRHACLGLSRRFRLYPFVACGRCRHRASAALLAATFRDLFDLITILAFGLHVVAS